ncbi:MAG: TAXI family TRAP transporter solute-binding subunit [Gemmatimonas sp.]
MSRIARLLAPIACLAVAMSSPARADEVINVLTGGTSGVYYPIGVALSNIYAQEIPGVRVSVQATKASVENLILLQQGRGEIAFTLGDTLAFARDGNDEAGFRMRLGNLRGIAAVYPNYIQIVATASSGIRTLTDMKRKRLSVGASKSGTELNARAVLGAAGLAYSDLGRVEYLPFDESIEMMRGGRIDGAIQSAGLGVSAIRDLASSMDVVVVEIPPAIVATIGAPYVQATIPGGTYRGQARPVATASIPNYLVTRADLPANLVYAMTKSMFERLGELAVAHPAAGAIKLAHALDGMPITLHPGAERYYREKGLLR